MSIERMGFITYHTFCAGRVVYPNPVPTVVGEEVLARIFIIS